LRSRWIVSAMAFGFLCCQGAQAQNPAPDNTKVNERDRSKTAATADQAKDNATDLEIMQKIRKAVVGDSSLSTYAHNVKIISQNGKVTLKGPVRSSVEKSKIEKMATDVAGGGNVIDQITVKPPTKKS